jgi:hypothetical protein
MPPIAAMPDFIGLRGPFLWRPESPEMPRALRVRKIPETPPTYLIGTAAAHSATIRFKIELASPPIPGARNLSMIASAASSA